MAYKISLAINKNQNAAYGSSDAFSTRPFAWRYVYLGILTVLMTTLFCRVSYAKPAHPISSCEIPQEEMPDAPVLSLEESYCSGNVCSFVIKTDSKIGIFEFEDLYIERVYDPVVMLKLATKTIGSSEVAFLTGDLSFFEGLHLWSLYTDQKNCQLNSVIKLKHNKARNEMDGSVEPPIR